MNFSFTQRTTAIALLGIAWAAGVGMLVGEAWGTAAAIVFLVQFGALLNEDKGSGE